MTGASNVIVLSPFELSEPDWRAEMSGPVCGRIDRAERLGSLAKRTLDLVGAISGLMLLFPLMLGLAALVRAVAGSPAVFSQKRAGRFGRPFTLHKFRTMADRRDEHGNLLPDAERVTRLGRFLRRTSLDEILELVNVLKGEMSLVGPRPLLTDYVERYTPFEARRLRVKPGMTGWAQINGRNGLSWEEKFVLDVWYVENRTFWLDLKILVRTATTVARAAGINAEGYATMPELKRDSRK